MSQDIAQLYSGKLLALAADIPHVGHLSDADASVRERAPLCGSTVSVDIKVEDGVITEFAQDVKACALGQASAAVVGAHIIGRNEVEIAKAHQQFKAFLTENGPVPDAPFGAFEALMPARDYKNRHASILLSITATLKALQSLQKLP